MFPVFKAHDVPITTGRLDNGREYCGRLDRRPYELFPRSGEIEHWAAKVCRQSLGVYVEHLHRT